ncbi:MAG: hypothetical protein RL653_566 [Pseudomonadota bacterium]|jgi:phosphatidylglycerol:prolipoprotein diacylglycerol transferase
MIPVLIQLTFDTLPKQILLYVAALGLVAYSAWSGYRGADKGQELSRALGYGVFGVGLALFGLHYALPKSVPLGGKGEGIPLHTYGLLLAAGFLSAATLAGHLMEREWGGEEGKRKREQMLDMSFYLLIGALVGSRVLFIVANWRDYAANPARIFDLGGGLVFYGGLIGATLAATWYARKNNIDFYRLADVAIPTVSLGQAFGRLGCFSAGCCWGGPAPEGTKLAVHFPDGTLAKTLFGNVVGTPSLAFDSMARDSRFVELATGHVTPQAVPGAVKISEWVTEHHHSFGVWPTQLFEAGGQLVLFGAFLLLRRYRKFHGMVFGAWLMAYAVLRTSVELFRGDTERGTLHHFLGVVGMDGLSAKVPLEAWWNISLGQFISLCMFGLGASILLRRRGSGAVPTPAVA